MDSCPFFKRCDLEKFRRCSVDTGFGSACAAVLAAVGAGRSLTDADLVVTGGSWTSLSPRTEPVSLPFAIDLS